MLNIRVSFCWFVVKQIICVFLIVKTYFLPLFLFVTTVWRVSLDIHDQVLLISTGIRIEIRFEKMSVLVPLIVQALEIHRAKMSLYIFFFETQNMSLYILIEATPTSSD